MTAKNFDYITCTRYKHRPKKSVLVCRKCRRSSHCRAYQRYRQPELPFVFNGRTETAPAIPTARGG